MNGKRDHVSSVAARAQVSDKSGLFHCISAPQGYKRDFRISCESVPMQVPDLPNSSKMKSHWRLTAIWTPKSRLAPLLNILAATWRPKGSPRPAKKHPKTGPRASQILKNEVPEATWSDFGAKTPFGILFGPPLAPTWRHKEAPTPCKGSQNRAEREPKRVPNETKSLLKIYAKFNIVSDIILEQKSIEKVSKI